MDLATLLLFTRNAGGSDLHVSGGAPPMVRVHGQMRRLEIPGTAPGTPLAPATVEKMIYAVLTESQQKYLEIEHELDFSITLGDDARFRGNVMVQLRGLAGVFRVIPTEIKGFDALGLPAAVRTLAQREKGLVLVTGPTGSGKSTTLAAMVDWVNSNRDGHIITIEDPVEFVHKPKRCMVNQREVGSSTFSFGKALRSALREDPDVILVGELRDLETISLAVTAAETGHLVFGTLHTMSAAKTVDRLVNVFPAGEQGQIRTMLAESLQGVVAQVLLPKNGGGRVAAHEILIATSASRAMIRDGKTHTLANVIQTGARQGMVSLEQSLLRLAGEGLVDAKLVAGVLADEGPESATPDVRPPERPASQPQRSGPSGASPPRAPLPATPEPAGRRPNAYRS